MWGDPNFITFDGKKTRLANEQLNNFWIVTSTSVQIQGYATDVGSWMQGVAVGGTFLKGHKLLAYRDGRGGSNAIRVFWDGREGSGSFPAWVQFHEEKGSNHLPSEAVLRKVFGDNFCRSCLEKTLSAWRNSIIYTFKLPGKVEIFMMMDTFSATSSMRKSVAVLVKMPPKGFHGGWCGNFNGNAGDDSTAKDQKAPPDENWFARAPDLPKKGRFLLMDVSRNATETRTPCEGEADMNEAEIQEILQACAHIAGADIRNACIEDICTDRRFGAALDAADEVAIMQAMHQGEPQECEPIR